MFAQAEALASEFFDGDMAAAFSMAQGLEFDVEQLARVNMRFRSEQVSSIAYSETVVPPRVAQSPVQAQKEPQFANTDPIIADPLVASPPAQEAAETVEPDNAAVNRYFDALSDFLRSIGEGFESKSQRYHYSESFKLTLHSAVMHTVGTEAQPESESDTR